MDIRHLYRSTDNFPSGISPDINITGNYTYTPAQSYTLTSALSQ